MIPILPHPIPSGPRPTLADSSRTISSSQTFLLKVVGSPLFIGNALVGTVRMFLGHPSDIDPWTRWIYFAVWVVGSLLVYRSFVPLKRVSVTDTALHISNFRREIVVPLRDIDEVREGGWGASRYHITLRFRRRTEFGNEIVFKPKARPLAFLSPNPLVAKLRNAAAQARLDVK